MSKLHSHRTVLSWIAISLGTLTISGVLGAINATAQPNMQPLGPNIADTGSKAYSFKTIELDSADGKRHYRIWVGKPNMIAPEGGYSILYMLDGNSAMNVLKEPLLESLEEKGHAPVIVAMGYQTNLPFDIPARAFDYTPPSLHDGNNNDSWNSHLKSGGSDDFRALLVNTIIPMAEQGLKINSHARDIWSHSYGGLFALDTLFTAPNTFNHYYVASPSLEWNNGQVLEREKKLGSHIAPNIILTLFHGGDEIARHQREDRLDTQNAIKASHGGEIRANLSPNAVPDLAKRLTQHQGIDVIYRYYPKLSHGPMFAISLQDSLKDIAGLPMSNKDQPAPLPPSQRRHIAESNSARAK